MVVDDEPDILELLDMLLRDSGYEVMALPNGQSALEQMEAYPDAFDLVLTDLVMPNLNGLELAHKIHGLRPDLPVLLITGYRGRYEAQLPADIREVLFKPVDLAYLAGRVAHHLQRAG
jgi:CheY-like chemotaxis protein